jgi:hypothetical protein
VSRTIAALAALLLAVAEAALANGGGRPGYTATVTSVTPAIAGVTLNVLDRDDRLELVNGTESEIVVLGYDGEPYLRFTPEGVFRNTHSPATYLNEDRYAQVQLPATADPEAEPAWERLAARNRYDWHDHRIHWMSPIDPPQVRSAPDSRHHVFDWEVPGTVDGRPFTIAGSLDYAPVDTGRPSWVYMAAAFGPILLGTAVFVLVRRSRERRTGGSAG